MTVHPHRNELLALFPCYQTTLFTNAGVYNEKIAALMSDGLLSLVTSMDSGTRKTFAKVKNVDCYEQTCENLIRYAETGGCIILKYIMLTGVNDDAADADDEYLPDFFERAVHFAEAEALDIVVCGTEMIQEATGETVEHRTHSRDWVIAGESFSELFPAYHWHVRQVWGKLYRRHTLLGTLDYMSALYQRELGEPAKFGLPYGADTINALYDFQRAERIGILSGCGHRYYIQNKSVSSAFLPNRAAADVIFHKETLRFLTEKCGFISERNRFFLAAVYANAVSDTVKVIHNSSLSKISKLREYRRIVEHPITKECFLREGADVARSRRILLAATLYCPRY